MEIKRIRKKFDYNGVEIRIAEVMEPYMNSPDKVHVTRVIAPNNGIIPINIRHKQALKSIMENTISLLDGFAKRGADVISELTAQKQTQ